MTTEGTIRKKTVLFIIGLLLLLSGLIFNIQLIAFCTPGGILSLKRKITICAFDLAGIVLGIMLISATISNSIDSFRKKNNSLISLSCLLFAGFLFIYGLFSINHIIPFIFSFFILILPFIIFWGEKNSFLNYTLLLGSLLVITLLTDKLLFKTLVNNYIIKSSNIFDEPGKDVLKKYEDRKEEPIAAYHHFLEYTLIPKSSELCNSEGFGGKELIMPKPENEIRIFSLGGSTTHQGLGSSSYPFHLQKYLDKKSTGLTSFNVQNAGVPAYTTLHSLINLESRVLSFDPDYVIIYHGINDLLYHDPDNFKADFSHTSFMSIMILDWVRKGLFPIRWHGLNLIPDSIWTERKRGLYYIRKISSIIDYLIMVLNIETTQAGVPKQKYINFPETYPKDIQPKGEGTNRISEKALKAFYNNIYNMVILCKSHGITPILTTFIHGDTNNKLIAKIIDGYARFITLEAALKVLEKHNDIIKTIARENNVPLFDIKQDLTINENTFCDDGVHFRSEFAEKLGSYIGEKLYPSLALTTSGNRVVN